MALSQAMAAGTCTSPYVDLGCDHHTAYNVGQLAPGSTLAVWLANEGLHAVDGHLTFDQIARILEELAVWSDAVQDPLTMGEKILARYPEAAASPARPT
jgi:hypothetical protein